MLNAGIATTDRTGKMSTRKFLNIEPRFCRERRPQKRQHDHRHRRESSPHQSSLRLEAKTLLGELSPNRRSTRLVFSVPIPERLCVFLF